MIMKNKNKKPLLSIVTPCFNEGKNIEELYSRVTLIINKIKKYDFEFIFIDNFSTDNSEIILRKLAKNDKRLKVIFNSRNFGHIRSPFYGILQSNGIATIYLASDLQDPPEKIPIFIKEWEKGNKLVMGVKPFSDTSKLMHYLRKKYYRLLGSISEVNIINDSTGFGLYDKSIVDHLRQLNEPYPFLRGLISELGFTVKTIEFKQPKRIHGVTKNNIYTLYDIAMLGIVNHSKIPIRVAAFLGLFIGLLSIIVAIAFGVWKIIHWNSFPIGIAPLIIGLFFLLGSILFFIGLLGEYISSIHSYSQNRPLVIERERVNFDN